MSLNNYSKILTFFMENGVQLTKEQLEILKEEFLNETRYISQDLDGFAHKHNVDTTSNIMIPLRKVDLLYKKYQRGELSRENYESQVKDIKIEYKTILGNPNAKDLFEDFTNIESRESFTKSVGARQNKNYVEDFSGKLEFTKDGKPKGIDKASLKNLSEEEYNKLLRQINIAQSTNDYREHKEAIRIINRLIGKAKDNSVGFIDKNTEVHSVPPGDPMEEKEMYHTSKQDNITELKGEFRSSGRMLYPDKRIFVSSEPMEKGGSRKKDKLDNKAIYKVKISDKDKLKSDKEFSKDKKSGYLEVDKHEAKQIKRTNEKK